GAGMVTLWELSTGKEARTLRAWLGNVTSVAFSPDGRRLASTSGNAASPGVVNVWDVSTGDEVLTLRGHSDIITGVAFSPDGQRLASASSDKTIRIWDTMNGQLIRQVQGSQPYTSVAYGSTGQR